MKKIFNYSIFLIYIFIANSVYSAGITEEDKTRIKQSTRDILYNYVEKKDGQLQKKSPTNISEYLVTKKTGELSKELVRYEQQLETLAKDLKTENIVKAKLWLEDSNSKLSKQISSVQEELDQLEDEIEQAGLIRLKVRKFVAEANITSLKKELNNYEATKENIDQQLTFYNDSDDNSEIPNKLRESLKTTIIAIKTTKEKLDTYQKELKIIDKQISDSE